MIEGSLLTILKDSPACKVTLKHKFDSACRALLTKNIIKESKIWVEEGSTFYSPLSMIAGSQLLGISKTKYSTKIEKNSKLLFGISIGTRLSNLIIKNGSQNLPSLVFLPTAFPYSNGHVLKVIHNFFEYSWSYSQSTPQSFHYRVVESPQCFCDRGVVIPPMVLHHGAQRFRSAEVSGSRLRVPKTPVSIAGHWKNQNLTALNVNR
jgi:hypothetical protein